MPPRASSSRAKKGSERRSSRRTQPEPEPDDQHSDNQNGLDADSDVQMDDETPGRADGEKEIARKANDLVRLALFMEHKRLPLKREDITKKILGSTTNRSSFAPVFELAQRILGHTLGMKLVELRSKGDLEQNAQGGNEELDEARNAAGVKKKAAAAGSKTWILCSTLDPVIINLAAETDEDILRVESANELQDADDDEEGFGRRNYGRIIAWNKSDQLGATGILYIILSLILVSGRVISDADLRSQLKRLRLPPTAAVSFNSQSTHKSVPIETYLNTLIRQGYIDKNRIGEPKGKGKGKTTGNKRGRAGNDDENNNNSIEWRWGPRAASEVGEVALARFVAEFMVGEIEEEADGSDDGHNNNAHARRRREADANAKMEKMSKAIERAAGGGLTDAL